MSGSSENAGAANKKSPQNALSDETFDFSMKNVTFSIDQPCSPIVTSKFPAPTEDNGIFTVTGNEIFKCPDSKKNGACREMSTVEKIKRSFECGDCRALGTCKTCGPYGICAKCRNKMKSENDAQQQAALKKEIANNNQEVRMIDALDLQKRARIDQPTNSNQQSGGDKKRANEKTIVAEIDCGKSQQNAVEHEVAEREPIVNVENEREAVETQLKAIDIESAMQEAVGFATIEIIESDQTQRKLTGNNPNEQKSIVVEETQRNPIEIEVTQLEGMEFEDTQRMPVELEITERNRECEQIQRRTIEFEETQQKATDSEKTERNSAEFDETERIAIDNEKTQRKTVEFTVEEIAESPREFKGTQRKLMERKATGIRPEELQRNLSTESIQLDRIDECDNDSYDGKMSKEEMEKNVNNWLKLEPLELDSIKKRRRMTFEEAMEHIKFGKFNYYVILLAGLIIMASFTEACGISYVMPVSECDLNLTTHHKGILGAVALMGTICAAYMWGYMADKKGRRAVIRPTLVTAIVFSIFSSFVKSFYIFAILRFCVGFFVAGATASIYPYLSEFHGKKHRSRSIMYAAVIFGILCFFLPFVAYAVINEKWHYYIPLIGVNYKPWRFFLVVCTMLEMSSLFFISMMPESPRYVLACGDKAETIRILELMNRVNNGKDAKPLDIDDIVDDDDVGASQTFNEYEPEDKQDWLARLLIRAPLLQPKYLWPLTLICIVQFSIFYTSNGFYIFFNEILNRMASNLNSFTDQRMDMCENINLHHAKANEFVVLNGTLIRPECVDKLQLETLAFAMTMEALYPIGFALISVLINRVPRFHIIFALLFTTGLSAIICNLTDVPIAQASAFIFFECAGIGGNLVSTLTVEIFPTQIRAVAVSITATVARLGGVVGSNISGALLDQHCKIAFYIPGIALIASAFLAFFIPNALNNPSKTKSKKDAAA